MSNSDLVYTDSSKYNLFQGIGYKVEKVKGTFYKFTEMNNPYQYANDGCPNITIYVPEGGMIHVSEPHKITSRFPPEPSRMIAGKRSQKATHKQSKNTRRRSRKN